MAPRRKIWLFRAIALSISGVLAFAFAEVGIRLWQTRKQAAAKVVLKPDASGRYAGYDTPGRHYESQENFPPMVFDAVTCYRPQPHHVGNGAHINGQGFRYPIDLAEPTSETFRVFVLGGSFAYGAGCPDDATYFHIAEKQLQQQFPNRKIEVVSAAVGAFSSLQEHFTLIARVARHKPDLVIIVSGANDAYFATKGQSVLEGNDYLAYAAAIRGCIDGRILRRYYYDQVFRDPQAPFPPLYDDYNSKVRWLVEKVTYNATAQTPKPVTTEDAMELSTADDFVYVQRLNAAWGREENVPTLLLLQPMISTVTKPLHERESAIHNQHTADFHTIMRHVHTQIRQRLANQMEIPWNDLTETVSAMSKDQCFFVDWVHAGETGQRFVGEHLAELIAERISNGAATVRERVLPSEDRAMELAP